MLKTRILLIAGSALVIGLMFLLPKVVVHNDEGTADSQVDSTTTTAAEGHAAVPAQIKSSIARFRSQYQQGSVNEKNAIFADSLAILYQRADKFDSAAWFAEASSKFFNTQESWVKAGNSYYQAYTFALDQGKQAQMAQKAQEFYNKVLAANPKNLEVKTKLAMTYFSSATPMQGVSLLREVLADDPKNELALFNLGMLSIQSGQNDRAIERLEELLKVNPNHIQGQLLLGVAFKNKGDKKRAAEQFEKVKQMDQDPAVQATVDSYLKDLK